MITAIKTYIASRKRRALIQHLEDLAEAKRAIAAREKHVENLIKSLDLVAVRGEVRAIQARGY